MYRLDKLHHGFDKHVIDIPLKDGTLCRTATHYFYDLEGPESLPHDHPFDIKVTVEKNSYIEHVYHIIDESGRYWIEEIHRKEDQRFVIKANTIHKLVDLPEGDCVTHVVQSEPYREWKHHEFDKNKEVTKVNFAAT